MRNFCTLTLLLISGSGVRARDCQPRDTPDPGQEPPSPEEGAGFGVPGKFGGERSHSATAIFQGGKWPAQYHGEVFKTSPAGL